MHGKLATTGPGFKFNFSVQVRGRRGSVLQTCIFQCDSPGGGEPEGRLEVSQPVSDSQPARAEFKFLTSVAGSQCHHSES
jgi:hypothetical protein